MRPWEFWLYLDAKRPPVMYGSMTENEVAKIYEEDFGSE